LASFEPIGLPFIELPAIDSTNNYAMAVLHEGMARHGMVVFTHHQQKGKGQRNKEWVSGKDMNIALSAVIEPTGLLPSQIFLLSMAIAVAATKLFKSYVSEDLCIKWPNDVYWRDRKAGGILIENVIKGNEWKYAVAGIGLNINQTDFGELNNRAVSLKQITGKSHDPLHLAKELCTCINEVCLNLFNDNKAIVSQYRNLLYKKNERVRLKKGNRVFESIIKDVTLDGRLVVTTSVEEEFSVGEVEWVLI
jgi:BirA family biotin operon repressor/biotin-[acetyl-CoA-carboxylase] ligase